jgi:hypothetical protein
MERHGGDMTPSIAALALFLAAGPSAPRIPTRAVTAQVGVMGEFLLHPGAFAGVEGRVLGRGRGELLGAGTLASYVHVRNHVGLMLWPELGGRVRVGRRVGLEAFAGVGYLHTFVAAPLYVVDDAGRVHRIRDRGRPAVMPTGSIGVSIATRRAIPFVRLQTFGQYPYNHSMLLHFAVLVGVRL